MFWQDRTASIDERGAISHEVDAFVLAHAEQREKAKTAQGESVTLKVTRQDVYQDWLKCKLGNAAIPDQVRLHRFQRSLAMRGNKVLSEGPDVIIHGNVTVKDQTLFQQVLRKGIGRHKSFGYGMLLLRPPIAF